MCSYFCWYTKFISSYRLYFYHLIETETNRIILKKIMESTYDSDADEDMYENRILTKYDLSA